MSADYDILEELMHPDNVDVLRELTDPRFIGRKHFTRRVYHEGCRGPLCRKYQREAQRAARERQAIAKGKNFTPERNLPRMDDRDDFLNAVVEWHCEQLAEMRAKRKTSKQAQRIQAKIDALKNQLEGLSA